MARPEHKPTDEYRKIVSDMILNDSSQEDIAKRLHICKETLIKYYNYEVFQSRVDTTVKIQNILLEKAYEGKRWAIELFLKAKAGWALAKPKEDAPLTQESIIDCFKAYIKAQNDIGPRDNSNPV